MRNAAPAFGVMCSWLIQQSHQQKHVAWMLVGAPATNQVRFSSHQHDHWGRNQLNKHQSTDLLLTCRNIDFDLPGFSLAVNAPDGNVQGLLHTLRSFS